jgi:DNA-binding IclR family transcriptional regulator
MTSRSGARRVADVLEAFLDGPADMGVTELARRLGCSKSVVHRILIALVDTGFLASDPVTRRYRLGPKARRLGQARHEHDDLRTEVLPYLRRIRERTGETATFSVLTGGARVYVEQVESQHTVRQTVRVGEEAPLHRGASGKSILAFLPESLVPTDARRPDLLAELRRVRRLGYAVSHGERIAGAASVAAPVFDHAGTVIGSISIAGVIARSTPRRDAVFGKIVRSEAAEFSKALGWKERLPKRR